MSMWCVWPSQVSEPVRRGHSRRPGAATMRLRRRFEALEDRRVLSVTSNFAAGTLSINLSAADTVAISASAGNVKLAINGVPGFDPDSGVLAAANVTGLVVTGSGDFEIGRASCRGRR